jgi:hypothetical protein
VRPTLTLLAIETLLGVGAWLLCGRRVFQAALGLLAATAPLEVYRTPVLGVNLSLFRISLVLALILVTAGGAWPDLGRTARDPVTRAYGLLAAVMAVSLVLISDNRSLAFRVFSQVVIGVVAVIVVGALVRRIGDPVRAAVTVLAGVALPILAALWQVRSSGGSSGLPFLGSLPAAPGLEVSRESASFAGSTVRAKATFADPNHFGAYCALLLGPAVGLLSVGVARRSIPTAATAAGLAAALGGMVLASESRSAWLAAAVCLIGAGPALVRPGLRRMTTRARIGAAAATLVLVGGLVAVAIPVVRNRTAASTANTESNVTHSYTLRKAADDLRSRPLLGIGLADFGPQVGEGPRTSGAHSTFLTIGAELGLIGLLAFVGALAVTGRAVAAGIRRGSGDLRRIAIGLACGFAGFATASVLYDLWLDDFQWVVTGVVVGICGALVDPLVLPGRLHRIRRPWPRAAPR